MKCSELKKKPVVTKTKRFSSKREEQEYLKKNYVNWEDLVIDRKGNVTWNNKTKKVLIEHGIDIDDFYPAKYFKPRG
jgi:hypothetical protein